MSDDLTAPEVCGHPHSPSHPDTTVLSGLVVPCGAETRSNSVSGLTSNPWTVLATWAAYSQVRWCLLAGNVPEF